MERTPSTGPAGAGIRTPGRDLAFPVALGIMVLLLLLRPIHDVDVFWQLRLGELTLQHGWPISTEPFAATHVGEPLVPVAWLGQVIFAAAFAVGGWPVLHAFDAILWATAFLVVARSAFRTTGNTRAAVAGLGLGFLASLPFASIRPQSFGLLAFALLIGLLRSSLSPPRKLALAAVLLVGWQNLHPSVGVAAATAVGAAAAGWVRVLSGRSGPRPWADTGVVVIAAAATLATPAGPRLLEVSAYNAAISRELGVGEWLPLWAPQNRDATSIPAAAALAATLLFLRRQWREVRAEDLGRAAVLTALLLSAHRFSPFWALAMIPVWATVLSPVLPTAAPPRSSGQSRLRGLAAALVCAGLGITLAVLVRPRLFAEYLPREGVARLRQEPVAGVVYCHPAWGGPLIGAGYPDWQVAYDGRYYVYTRQEWQAYLGAARGEVPLEELNRGYWPVAYFVRPGSEDGLIARLRGSPAWTEIHADHACVIFVRRAPES